HPNSYLNAVNAYNAYVALNPGAGPAIDITPIGQTQDIPAADDLTDPIVAPDGVTIIGEIDFTPQSSATLKLRSGTWELYNGQPAASFLAVDGGQQFVLYELSNPTTSGDWDTFDIPGVNDGQNPKLYRLVLFDNSAVVPEPATWAMLLLGFGMAGASMRMRRRTSLAAV
ncbi:MAG TPA: PEPxxWA-CTERM sorting domain-containing protein, partial [Rhizomicrobium sp.]|nr:PEPxxWA-CTERM sorting domain-containing protein [Rhizomicrobium sp.]